MKNEVEGEYAIHCIVIYNLDHCLSIVIARDMVLPGIFCIVESFHCYLCTMYTSIVALLTFTHTHINSSTSFTHRETNRCFFLYSVTELSNYQHLPLIVVLISLRNIGISAISPPSQSVIVGSTQFKGIVNIIFTEIITTQQSAINGW